MDLFFKKDIQSLLKSHGLKPSKGLGQNFLVNRHIADKIIESAELSKKDVVLEIGPGIGNLTLELAKKAGKVIAVEKDRKMAELLDVESINEDILKFNAFPERYKVVANLPYYIASHAIRKLLETENQPQLMILMVQKEVGQRICAKPPDMSLLAVSVQFYSSPKIVSYVKKEDFWPKPKVDSAILKITDIRKKEDSSSFFKIVKAGFSNPRKQLLNNLSKVLSKDKVSKILLENNINPSQRPETLSIEDWERLWLCKSML